jgi:hypothetical protein
MDKNILPPELPVTAYINLLCLGTLNLGVRGVFPLFDYPPQKEMPRLLAFFFKLPQAY